MQSWKTINPTPWAAKTASPALHGLVVALVSLLAVSVTVVIG